MKSTFLLGLLVLATSSLSAQTEATWMRHPSISPDGAHIAFTYMGDLYRVSSSGGDAVQLTFHEAHDFMPVWSPDGKTLAFASDRYGNFDVYTMDAMGGSATRLSFHSTDELPYSFSFDGKMVRFGAARMDAAEHRQFPTASQPELYEVPITGGRVNQVFTIPAEYVVSSRDGDHLLYHDKKGGENEWRKHHRSAITRDIWIYHVPSRMHKMLTSWQGEDRQPVFSADEKTIYFLSEESGTFNVHSIHVDNPDIRTQVTSFRTHPVRFLSQGNGTLAFGYHGDLYTMKPGAQPVKLTVRVRTQAKSNSDSFISINGGVSEMAISPDGQEIAFIARGEVFVTNVDGSRTKRLTDTPEAERFLSFSHDGKAVVYSSQRNGKWSLYKTERTRADEPYFYASTIVRESLLVDAPGDHMQPAFSPDGTKLAFIVDRHILRVRDVANGRSVDVLTGADLLKDDQVFSWSPDSKWLLAEWRRRLSEGEILLVAADGSKRVNLTESGSEDNTPKWAGAGKQMLWFTNRDGLRSYATAGQTERDVYSMFFTQEAWDAFSLSEDDHKLKKAVDDALKKADSTRAARPTANAPLTFDWNGLTDRRSRLTIHSSQLADAVLSKDGEKLYYLTSFENNYNLWETSLRSRETKQLVRLNTGAGRLMWDKDMENLYLLSRGSISKINVSAGSSSSIRISGEMRYDANAEREHMYNHVVTRSKSLFYEPTYHGIDWDFMAREYRKFLPHVSNSNEFAEVLAELLGELNVSHSGARYSTSMDNGDATASLGIFIDYSHRGPGMKITEVIQGGPLDKAGFDVRPGMVIETIDGVVVGADRDIAAFLNRKADTFVVLGLTGPGRNDKKEIVAKPITLGAERALLYRRFVRINEEEVTRLSNGRLGYVHVPGMNDGTYRSVLQDMLGKYDGREGVVVDARFNGGGDLVADLVMFFTGTKFATYATSVRDVDREPTSRWYKPTISLYNESMYSDGHCYAAAYSGLKLGKSVGMPVPGTCSFAAWETLPDRTRWGVVPISARNINNEWMENNQTSPDIEVKNMPGSIDRGVDQQLVRAVEELLKELNR